MMRRACGLALLVVLACGGLGCGGLASSALADGDPGSDVLVYQPLFLSSDSGISIGQQVQLGGLVRAASRAGFPIRVAIVSSSYDLGAVTALWRKPRAYARFLGIELSLAYQGRLLVVMPNGFGFNWPGHSSATAYRNLARVPIKPGGSGLAAASEAAVRSLAGAAGIKLSLPPGTPSGVASTSPADNGSGNAVAPAGQSDGSRQVVVLAILVALVAGAVTGTVALRRRRAGALLPFGAVLTAGAGVAIAVLSLAGSPSTAQSEALAHNPNLDPGTRLSAPAPDFTLTDQFGQATALHSFRGKVVILAFNDSECTTICPLTTTAMLAAKAMLGKAGTHVQLLGIDANPTATALEDVLSYSELHGMLHQWHFLTGSLPQLRRVWKAYSIGVDISQRQIDHSPAVFVIGTDGRLAKLYVTQQSYAAVGQFGQVLAQEASTLLPGHPRVGSSLSYAQISGIRPSSSATLPKAGGGTIRLGPGRPHLYLFFATWDREITGLSGQLNALNAYQVSAARAGLPGLIAVDEASVEPSGVAVTQFLRGLGHPPSYPVAIDRTGRLADGYEVQGEPWFVLTSPTGRILWYWQVSTSGWLSRSALAKHVRDALARAPQAPSGALATRQLLAGSPPLLSELHRQAGRLLGSGHALDARVRTLRGYPIVINAWASWCTPCRSEFSLFASASAHYGRSAAFLGADTNDSPGDAQAFLTQHPVSYPSYQSTTAGLGSIVPQGVLGLPTTIFINRSGKMFVHTGQYESQGTLDSDIASYALGR